MTMTQTLLTTLATSELLFIDGLHAFDFTLDEQHLSVLCMDGRIEKRWTFSREQIEAATFDASLQSWTLTGDTGEHRLVCLDAVTGNNNDEDEADDDA